MNRIVAQARMTVEGTKRAAVTPHSVLKRILDVMVSAFIRNKAAVICGEEGDVAERYQGRAWCDSTEHDINCDVMTGRRRRM